MSHAPATETRATVTLTIDGKSVEVKRGATILEASNRAGVKIPTLCWLHKTHPIGSCRVCSVEVEGVDAPVMSCCTPAADGMAVVTENERLKEFRRNMVQFILVNHPLDCPVCERSGECKLQNMTVQFGIKKHDWATAEVARSPVAEWGLVRYNRNLCIMCERCVHVCREVQGVAALKVNGNGYGACINTETGAPLDCDFCGQCISVCPVGALSSGMYFSGRSWEMRKTASVCPHCGVGCSFHYNVKNGKIVRVTSADGLGNNKGNLCVRGRFGYEFTQHPERLTTPLVRKGDGFEAADWDYALALIAEKLSPLKGSGAAAGIASERGTNEDAFALVKFFRQALGGGTVDNIGNLLAPASGGAVDGSPLSATFDELKEGNIFLYIGMDGSNENPVVSNHVREAIYGHGAEVALAFSGEAFFNPPPRMKLAYDYAALHHFVLALLGETARAAKGGGFAGGVAVEGDFAKKLEAALPDAAAKLDDTLKKQVPALAALLKKKQKPVFLVGLEAQRHPQGAAILQNIANLAAVSGGRVMLTREYSNSVGVGHMGAASTGGLNGLAAKALIIAEEDPLGRYPDAAAFRAVMQKAEFKVVIDQFKTPTALAADVILPSCGAAEKDGTFTNMEGRIQQVVRAVDPVGKSLPVWRIMSLLSEKMGAGLGYSAPGDVGADIARAVPGYGNIAAGGAAGVPGGAPAPSLKWADPAPIADPKASGALALLSGPELFSMGSYSAYCPSPRAITMKNPTRHFAGGGPRVEINAADAQRMGLKDLDVVVIRTPEGELRGTVKTGSAVKAGAVRVPREMDRSATATLVAGGREFACVNHVGMAGGKS